MMNWTVGSTPGARHVLRLQADSAIVEGFVSVIFDLLILATAEMLIHNICSHHNLRIVYDNCAALYLRSRAPTGLGRLLPEVAVGPSWLSRALSILLFFVSVAAVLLGFAINGLSDNEFSPSTFSTVASIPYPPTPVEFDYAKEYRYGADQQNKEKPKWMSRRLVALAIVDQCQICTYDQCQYIAYAFEKDDINNSLVEREKEFEKLKNMRVECVTKAVFRESIVNWNVNRMQKTPRPDCTLVRVDVPSIQDNAPTNGNPVSNRCDVKFKQTRCFRRPGAPVCCALVGEIENMQRLTVFVVKDAAAANNSANVDQAFFEISGAVQLSDDAVQRYLDNVAFLASLNIAGAYKLDLMSFVHLSHDVTLDRRNRSKEVNVSEVDLRIAIPSVVVLVLSTIMLSIAAIHAWVIAVYYKRRQNFNSFTTVPDVLELLLDSGAHLNRSRQDAAFSPVVGIRKDQPRIGVQAPGEDLVGGATIDEAEVL